MSLHRYSGGIWNDDQPYSPATFLNQSYAVVQGVAGQHRYSILTADTDDDSAWEMTAREYQLGLDLPPTETDTMSSTIITTPLPSTHPDYDPQAAHVTTSGRSFGNGTSGDVWFANGSVLSYPNRITWVAASHTERHYLPVLGGDPENFVSEFDVWQLAAPLGSNDYHSLLTQVMACTQPQSSTNCGWGFSGIHSTRRVAVEYLPSIGDMVVAYSRHERHQEGNGIMRNHELTIHVGAQVPWALSQFNSPQTVLATDQRIPRSLTDSSSVRTAVGPGVACKQNTWPSADCLVAYVDQADPLHRIAIRPLYIDEDPLQWVHRPWTVTAWVNPIYPSNQMRTSSDIELWVAENRYWLAYQRIAGDEHVEVWSSSDGQAWVFEKDLGAARSAPSVAEPFTEAGDEFAIVFTANWGIIWN